MYSMYYFFWVIVIKKFSFVILIGILLIVSSLLNFPQKYIIDIIPSDSQTLKRKKWRIYQELFYICFCSIIILVKQASITFQDSVDKSVID